MKTRKFGRYEIQGTLGRGSMGVVYKAFDPLLERSLAIKVMSPGTDEEAVRRFFREARATAGLRHPNIVSVYDIGEEDRQPYIAIEYLDGQDLGQFLKQGLFIPFVWKLRLIIDICRGLQHAHDNGIIHRDIKPSNIRITREGKVKIVDFGVAKLKSSEMTATGMVVGTPSYMSPQQVRGGKQLDGRSDLFSLGVLLFELITGRKPFAAPELHAVMFQICNVPHPPLTEILPACSEDLAAIVDRALAKDIEDRFQSGEEMAVALEQFLKQLKGVCSSLQEAFDKKAKQLQEQCSRLEEESLTKLIPRHLQQIPPSAFDPDQTIHQDFGLFQAASQPGADYGELLHREAALNRQLEDLKSARKGFKEVRQWYSQSREQFENGLWEPCLASLEAILKKQPNLASALELKKECQARLKQQKLENEEKSRQDELLKQARSARKSEQPDEAQKLAAALLKLEPAHSEAASIRDWAREARQRQAELEEYLAQARERSQAGDCQGCLEAVRSGLELDPDHKELGRLQEQSQQILDNLSQAEELLEQARSQFEAGRLEACLETVKKGLKQLPDHRSLKHLEVRARSEKGRRQQVSKLFERAQAEYGQGQYGQVLKSVQSLLDLDSSHQQARQLSEQARQAWEVREQLQPLIKEARTQLEANHPAECLETLRRGLELDSGNAQLKELKLKVEAELVKRLQADQALATAREEAESRDGGSGGEFRKALKHLARALELNPDLQEARALQAELQAEQLLLQAKRFEEKEELPSAWDAAGRALKLAPQHTELKDLHRRVQQRLEKIRQQEERAAKIRKGVLRARLALRKGRLGTAHKAVSQVLKWAPSHADAKQLHQQVRAAKQQRQVRLRKGGLAAAAAALALILVGYLLWPFVQ